MSKSFEQVKEMLKNNDPILLRHICKSMCFWTGMPIKKFLLWECDPFRETIEKIKKGHYWNLYAARSLGYGDPKSVGSCGTTYQRSPWKTLKINVCPRPLDTI